MAKIVYSGPKDYVGAAQDGAGRAHEVTWVPATAQSLERALPRANAFVDASMRVTITGSLLKAATELAVISCATTGSDHIEKSVAERIPVITLRDAPELLADLTPAAELSWALVLACARQLPSALRHVREGGWVREEFPGMMLNSRRLGIIGFGRIGRWIARYGQAFGMEIVTHDPYASPPLPVVSLSLEELFETSDVISVHVPLNDETTGLVSSDLFRKVKPGAIFINTSRSAVIDESALLDVLRNGRLGAAGLDVLDGEPNVTDNPLRRYAEQHENLLITPHCGGFSPDALRKVIRHASRAAASVLNGVAT